VSEEKRLTLSLSTYSPNMDRFQKFFHRRTLRKICSTRLWNVPSHRKPRRYTTSWNI